MFSEEGDFSVGKLLRERGFSKGRIFHWKRSFQGWTFKVKLYTGKITRILRQSSFYFAHFLFENSNLHLKIPRSSEDIFLRRGSPRGDSTQDKATIETMWEENYQEKNFAEGGFLAWFEKLEIERKKFFQTKVGSKQLSWRELSTQNFHRKYSSGIELPGGGGFLRGRNFSRSILSWAVDLSMERKDGFPHIIWNTIKNWIRKTNFSTKSN